MAMLFPDTGASQDKKSSGRRFLKSSGIGTSAAGKGREGFLAGLSAAGENVATPLTVLGSHQWVATKKGIKRVKRR